MAARLQFHFRLLAPMFVQSKHLPSTCPAFPHPRRTLHLKGPPYSGPSTLYHGSCLSSRLQAAAGSQVAAAALTMVGQRVRGGSSIQRSLRCTATKASKSKTKFCCSSCGHDTFQHFGKCPSCGEFGTYATHSRSYPPCSLSVDYSALCCFCLICCRSSSCDCWSYGAILVFD